MSKVGNAPKDATVSKTRNASIDIFRLIFAIGVVMGHTYFLYDVSPGVAYWTSRAIPRMAVPFFFCISGYYYIKGLLKGRNPWKKQIKKILTIYIFWTLIYYLFSFLLTLKNHESIKTFLILRVRYFFFDGSFYHFWYFVAFIYVIIMVTIFYAIGKNKGITVLAYLSLVLYLLAFLGTRYCNIGQKIPVIGGIYDWEYYTIVRGIFAMGLPFFMMGYFLNKGEEFINKISNKTALILFVIIYVLYLGEALYAKHATTVYNASEDLAVAFFMLPALYMLFVNLLKHPMPELYEKSVYCRKISNFMYYIHPLLIQIIITGSEIVGIGILGSESVVFIIVFTITMVGGYILSGMKGKLVDLMV